jgi:lactocepin
MHKLQRMKKSMAILLVFLLTFSNFAFAAPIDSSVDNSGVVSVVNADESVSVVDSQQIFEDNEKVRVIVELDQQAPIEYATAQGVQYSDLSDSTQVDLEEKATNAQEDVKMDIANNNIAIEYENNFTTVFNGFSGEVQFGDISKIESLPNVKAVYLANEYERPIVEPEMATSHEFIQSYKAWNDGKFKGEGMVVAVIDSGMDPAHRDMVLNQNTVSDLSETKVNSIKTEQGLLGRFYTNKIPYGYNYFDKSLEIRDLVPGGSNHGMHVGGTIGANGNPEDGGIKGVAPESQLLAMKVFSNDPGYASTFSDIYLVAIDESIKLGADVLNMSLGSVASFYSPEDPANIAITRAVDNGVVASVSAGNSRHIGRGYKTPFAENPDIGLVGAPGLSYDSIQVAASGNKVTAFDYNLSLSGTTVNGFGYTRDNWVQSLGNKAYELVSLGSGKTGAAADYTGLDVKGKIVILMRGGTPGPFIDKAAEAARQGAAGIIVYDAGTGGTIFRDLGGFDIPFMLVTKPVGDEINTLVSGGKTTLTYSVAVSVQSAQNGRPTEFSSWGTTPSLDIKPELMAPGGNIYSTLNNNKYGWMSGTSMAAPHVAGGSALVMQYIKEHAIYKHWSLKDQARIAKVLLMNTAEITKGTNNFAYSPRLQGAGQMQIFSAMTTPVRVVNPATNEAKVELRDFTSKVVDFKVKAINDSTKKAVTYKVDVDVLTDAIQRLTTGDVNWSAGVASTGDPHLRGAEPLKNVVVTAPATVTVPAGGTVDISVKIDLTNAKIPGYTSTGAVTEYDLKEDIFVDGFVRLTDVDNVEPKLVVPYVGFYGKWDRPNILDGLRHVDSKYFFTDGGAGLPVAGMVDNRSVYLGSDPVNGYLNAVSKYTLSPNGDGMFDTIVPVMSFLRNASDVHFNILDENGNKIRTIRTENSVRKNYAGQTTRHTYSTTRAWDGKVNGQIVPDGKYFYEIKSRVDLKHREAVWQTKRISFVVDTKAPTVSASYDVATKQLTWTATDGQGIGLQHFQVLVDGVSVLAANQLILSTIRNYDLTAVTVPAGANVEVVAYDFANNISTTKASIKTSSTEKNIPVITLESPTNWSLHGTNTVTVKGYVRDESPLAAIFVNGTSVAFNRVVETNEERYRFSTDLTLAEGVHDIIIKAVDLVGNEVQISRRPVFVDTTPATLSVSAPQVVENTVGKTNLQITVSDNNDQIRVYVNDDEVLSNAGPASGVATTPFSKTFTSEVALKEGNNTFTVRAVDLVGFTTTRTVNVYKLKAGETPAITEIKTTSVSPNTFVSYKKAALITATSSESITWSVKVVNPSGKESGLPTATGGSYNATFKPGQYDENGLYTVVFSGVNAQGVNVTAKEATFTVYNYPIVIENVAVTDQLGNAKSTFGQTGTANIQALIKNFGSDVEKPMLIIQIKDSNNRVVEKSFLNLTKLNPDDSNGLGMQVQLDKLAKGTYSVDVFVWTGWDMAPLAEAKKAAVTFTVN